MRRTPEKLQALLVRYAGMSDAEVARLEKEMRALAATSASQAALASRVLKARRKAERGTERGAEQ